MDGGMDGKNVLRLGGRGRKERNYFCPGVTDYAAIDDAAIDDAAIDNAATITTFRAVFQ